MNTDARRGQMLAHIRPLIEERGYDAVSVDAMAKASGVAKATFYRIFPSKEAVRQALAGAGVTSDRLDTRDGRDAVIEAATEIFAAEGYTRTTVDALAAAAGMSKAGVYWHFDSKVAIFAAVIARFAPFDTLSEMIASAEAAGTTVEQVLHRALTTVMHELVPRAALFRVVFFELTTNPELAPVFDQFITQQALPIMGGYLARQMAAGHLRSVPLMLAIQTLIGPLYFYLFTREQMQTAFGTTPTPEEAVASVVQTFMDGNRR